MSASRTIPVELTLFGGTLRAAIPVPDQPATPQELLPLFQSVAEAVIHLSIKHAERQGRAVSCRAGCGACCRQFVPIAEPEARSLLALVEASPEPRRSILKQRFADAVRRIDQAGLRDRLMAPESQPRESLKTVGVEYFRLQIPCPFLESESCSIHPDRPLICREYLVTSPAEQCWTLDGVSGVDLPARASLALCRIDEDPSRIIVRTIPLTMIFEWAKTAGSQPAPRPPEEHLRTFLRHLGARTQPAEAPPGESRAGCDQPRQTH